MVNSKKTLFISLTVSSALIILGIYFLSEAHALWTRYKFLSSIPHIPYEAYMLRVKPFLDKYDRWFLVYLIGGLVLFVSGVTTSFFAVRKKLVNWVLHRGKKE